MESGQQNTDKEIWRQSPGDYYSDSIHVTEHGGIGINHGGHVMVAPLYAWFEAGQKLMAVNVHLAPWRRKLAYRLLGWKDEIDKI